MEYMDVKTASEKWGITPRRVRILCNDGRIDGAVRNGWSWVIPSLSAKPTDGRILRKYKSFDIRPGNVDVEELKEYKRLYPVSTFLEGERYNTFLAATISSLFALEGEEISSEDVLRVLEGNLCYSLGLREHIIIVNFSSLLKENAFLDEKMTMGRMKRLYASLVRGIINTEEKYEAANNKRENEMDEEDNMELVINQFSQSWSHMHPLSSSLLLSGEIMRLGVFKDEGVFFCYLIFAFQLMRNGFISPSITLSSLNELKASYALIASKGVYTDMTEYMERMICLTYREIAKNV